MSLRVLGAGVGRTGTRSLKVALAQLLDAPCYHMSEVFEHPEHIEVWRAAIAGQLPDWATLFAGYRAAVDWPAAAFWPELTAAYPDALVVLSVRPTLDWWRSAERTIFDLIERPPGSDLVAAEQASMANAMIAARFTPDYRDQRAACDAYEAHNGRVRSTLPPERLIEWSPGDGWDPLCAALDLPIPDEAFPHVNTTQEFRERRGLDT